MAAFDANVFADTNCCAYLFLREFGEPRDNTLRLLIEEGVASSETVSTEIAGQVIPDCHPIISGGDTRLFEIIWDLYIAYSVRNESYVERDESEEFELGNRVRIYSKSKFLEYVAEATFASDEYPGRKLHVGVICENHVVDVISTALPKITRLRPF